MPEEVPPQDPVGAVLQELASAGQEDLGRLLQRAFRVVNTAAIEHLRALGHDQVRVAHASVFFNLDAEGTRMTTLAQRAGISRQAIGQLVRDLGTSGYVALQPDPDDGRAQLVVLTERGVAFCLQAVGTIAALEQRWAHILGPGGLEQLRHGLALLGQHDAGPDD